MYGGNVFGHTTFKNDFLALELDDCYDNNNNTSSTFASYYDSFFDFVKWHARLGHIG